MSTLISDDTLMLLVYALMLALIIALLVGAYFKWKSAQKGVSYDDKLTAENSGVPEAQSRFNQFDP